jgi:hypothetical protein
VACGTIRGKDDKPLKPVEPAGFGICGAPVRPPDWSSAVSLGALMQTLQRVPLILRLLVAMTVVAAFAGAVPAAASTAACQSWSQPLDVSAYSNELYGITVTAGCNAWAVGYDDSTPGAGAKSLIEHWDGSAWSVQSSPDPGDLNVLRAAAAISVSDAWAVGNYRTATGGESPLVVRWDGTAWTQVTSPSPAAYSLLLGVSATSSSNAWAVGYYYNGTAYQTLIEHWDGTAWTQVTSPSEGTSASYLTSVAATSASNAWAVGYYYDGTADQPLILHWNGTVWTQVASPNPGGPDSTTQLSGVAATSHANAWAVGYYGNGSTNETLIEHWNGTVWTQVASPNPGGSNGSYLADVASASAGSAWAVGSYEASTTSETLVEHWNGTSWTQVASPNPGGTHGSFLHAVASYSSDAGTAGYYSNGTVLQALARHL